MCPWLPQHSPQHLMTDETLSAVGRLLPLAESVDLSGGGEPLLHPRFMEMVQSAKEAGCVTGFSTNATLLHPSISRALVAMGLDWIGFSIDGATPETYESIRAGAHLREVQANVQGLRAVKAEQKATKPAMFLVYVLMRRNLEELPAAVEWAASAGVERMVVKHLDLILKKGDEEQTLLEVVEEGPRVQNVVAEAQSLARRAGINLRVYGFSPEESWICEINPLRNLFINWEGYVSPCITLGYGRQHYFRGQWHSRQTVRFGNVRQKDLMELWKREPYREFRASYSRRERTWLVHSVTTAAEGRTRPAESFLPPAPAGCQTCYYLHES